MRLFDVPPIPSGTGPDCIALFASTALNSPVPGVVVLNEEDRCPPAVLFFVASDQD